MLTIFLTFSRLRMVRVVIVLLFCIFCCAFFNIASSAEKLILLSTTSLENCELFDKLLPPFEKKYNCSVKVIAVGSGQAIRLAYDGQGDVLFTHDKKAEEKFVKEGYGVARLLIMHNYFFVVGPKKDPAGIKKLRIADSGYQNRGTQTGVPKRSLGRGSWVVRIEKDKAKEAFKKIYKTKSNFVSRGDNSGTHKKEKEIWKKLNIKPKGRWYIESGAGMEMTLRIANEKKGYCLVDKATWLTHRPDMDMLEKILEGDPILYNPYSIIVVSPTKFPWVNYKLAQKFVEFIREKEGQEIIKNFGIKEFREPLYFSD